MSHMYLLSRIMCELHTNCGSGAKLKLDAFTKNLILFGRHMVSHFTAGAEARHRQLSI